MAVSEMRLDRLLMHLAPELADGEFAFCSVSDGSLPDYAHLQPLGTFGESEGLTLVLPVERAASAGLAFDGVFRLISLGANSSLEAVGLTAAVAGALADEGISANVVAAFHHDHLFVPAADADRALVSLRAIQSAAMDGASSACARYRERFGEESALALADNAVIRGLMSRRSHRRFKSLPIEPSLLHSLFAAAFSAPSKSDLQQVSVVRVTDRDRLERIAACDDKVRWIADAPEFMVWCGDSRRIRRLAGHRGHPFANDHLDAFMNAAVDTGIAMQTFIVAAESVGLGCCPVSEVRDHVDILDRELSLPAHVFPVAGLCVGWPAEAGRLSMRLPLAVTVHDNTYDDEDLFGQVTAYDRRREAAHPTPPDAQRDTARFGISDDYGWSENRARQYARPMRTDFGAYIRRKNFDLS